MRILHGLIIIVLIWLPWQASAEYYKYRDQNGVLRFTDNVADIPEDQRPKAESYSGSEDSLILESSGAKRQNSEKNQTAKEQRMETEASAAKGSVSSERMRQTRDALEKEHAALTKEKEALEAERETLRNAKQIRAYKKKVTQLNAKISAFDKRRQAFQKEVEAFNKAQSP